MVVYACPGARRTPKSSSPAKPSLQVEGLSLADFFSYRPTEYQAPGSECRMQANREWVRSQLLRMTAIPSPRATGAGGLGAAHDAAAISVDTNTLKWKSWVGQPPDDGEVDVPDPGSPYKLTQTEFRRLHDQVREGAGQPPSGRQRRGSGFKDDISQTSASTSATTPAARANMLVTYDGRTVASVASRQSIYVIKPSAMRSLSQCGTYAIPNPFPPQKFVTNDQGLTTPVVHRSQLASSFRAFHDKRWRPYEGGSGREGAAEGSGPPSRTSSRLSSRPSSCGSVRSDQRLLEKRCQSSIGHRSPVTGRPRTGVDSPGGTYRHPANVYTHQQNERYQQQAAPGGAVLQGRGSQPDLTDSGSHPYSGDNIINLASYGTQTSTSLTRQGSVPNLAPLHKVKASMTPAATEITKPSDQLALAYDTLTPEIIYQLSAGPRPLSVYGSRPTCYRPEVEVSRTRSDKEEDSPLPVSPPGAEDPDQTSPGSAKRDTDSTSGIGTDKESDGEDEDLDDDDGDRDSNDSDDERIPEPKLEDIKMADLPRLNLRPEQLDAMYIPDQRHDRRRYDFDPTKCEVIPYEFKDALSPPLMALDLHQASLSDRHWRSFTKAPASDATEEKIVERLLELEALQRKTKELETLRRDRLRSAHVRARSRVGTTMRQQSAKMGERKCCADCLQVACVGDCPGKRANPLQRLGSSNCLICAERDCDGRCCQSAYDARSRQARVQEEEPKKPNRFRPRSCTSCTSKNPSKTSNANNILLYRPKSSYSTFSSSQNSNRPPRDMRPKGGHVAPQLEEEFERLGIGTEPDHQGAAAGEKQPASGTRRKLKGRASQLPGKSFFSQRRHSLTDIAKEMRVKSANKKRLKGGKKKSSKTDSEA